jgi:hypothetical protein
MRPTLTTTAIVAACLCILPGAVAARTDCLDQQHEPAGTAYLFINGDLAAAQTFTVGLAGRLQRVDLLVGKVGTPAGPLILELRPTVAGVPAEDAGSVIASRTVPEAEIVGGDYVVLDLAGAAVEVSPGDVFAIVARSPQSGTSIDGDIYTTTWDAGGAYAGGLAYFQAFDPAWQMGLGEDGLSLDFGFHAYLDCSTAAEARTWSAVKVMFR